MSTRSTPPLESGKRETSVLEIYFKPSSTGRNLKVKVVRATCCWCQRIVEKTGPRGLEQVRRGRVYCSPPCRDAKVQEIKSLNMAQTNRKYASARMTRRNLERSPEARAKMTAGFKKAIADGRVIPYGRGLHGNGRPPTPSEEQALRLLGPWGFLPQAVVRTGEPRGSGFPAHYKVDVAHKERMIAVEVDGSSHVGREVLDAKKDKWLKDHGWMVLRVPSPLPRGALAWLKRECSPSKRSKPSARRFTISK